MFEVVNNVCCNVGLDSADAVTHQADSCSPMLRTREKEKQQCTFIFLTAYTYTYKLYNLSYTYTLF